MRPPKLRGSRSPGIRDAQPLAAIVRAQQAASRTTPCRQTRSARGAVWPRLPLVLCSHYHPSLVTGLPNAHAQWPRRATRAPLRWSGMLGCRTSLDHLICPLQKRLGDRQPKGLGGLEVDDQLARRRLLDGQVGGLSALEDLAHERSAPPTMLTEVHPIGHQPACLGLLLQAEN